MWSGNRGVKEELVFWLERLEKVSSQSIRSEPVTTGSTRVARKGNEINEKRFQSPLLDWEVGQSSTYREVKSMEMGINLL